MTAKEERQHAPCHRATTIEHSALRPSAGVNRPSFILVNATVSIYTGWGSSLVFEDLTFILH